jgi:hypothetical protein
MILQYLSTNLFQVVNKVRVGGQVAACEIVGTRDRVNDDGVGAVQRVVRPQQLRHHVSL